MATEHCNKSPITSARKGPAKPRSRVHYANRYIASFERVVIVSGLSEVCAPEPALRGAGFVWATFPATCASAHRQNTVPVGFEANAKAKLRKSRGSS
jgi:hypothetical protein